MIVDKINKYLSSKNLTLNEYILSEISLLAKYTFRRQFMENFELTEGKLRLSGCGSCARRLAYAYFGYEPSGKEIDSRAKIVFWMGDLVEITVIELAKLAGVKVLATGLNQITVKLNIEGVEIEGHPDGFLLNNGELILLEVKSMSDYGFNSFQKGEIDDGYLSQVNAYMHVLNLNKTIFVAINKNSGVMHEVIVKKDNKIVDKLIKNLKTVIKSSPDKLPKIECKPNSKGFYDWHALYCPYWKICLKNAEKVLVGKSYKLKCSK